MRIKEDAVSGHFIAIPETDHEERMLGMASVTSASLKAAFDRPVLVSDGKAPTAGSVLLSGSDD